MNEHQGALDTLTYGVYIATCKAGDKMNGLTLGWVSQVSVNPTLLAIAVHKPWYSHGILSQSDYFIVHVLAEDQTEIAKFFGSTHGWDTNKFEGIEWQPGVDGIPVIKGCKAVMECKKITEVPAGDHTLFIGEVISSQLDEQKKEQVLDRKLYFG